MLQSFRQDRVVAAAHLFVSAVLGESFMAAAEKELELAAIVEGELRAHVPALFCSVPGFDASGRVDDLATELSKPCTSIAIGEYRK
jgi:dynein heavy chain 1